MPLVLWALIFLITLPLVWLITWVLAGAWFRDRSTGIKRSLKNRSRKVVPAKNHLDLGRREFLRLAGTLGIGALLLSLFRRPAQAIQFGGTGVPDPIGIEPLGNAQTTGSVTLTDANIWYQVPASNQASRVFLALHNRSGYDMYWAFDNTISASTDGLLFPSGGTLQLDAGSTVKVYVRCGTAAQAVWYAESQSQ